MIEVKAGYKQTEVGLIPEDWDVVVFENIADKTKKWGITGGPFGSNLKTSDYTNDGVQIIQLQNIGDGNFIDDNQIFTSEEKANELLSCNIYPNEIILSKMGDPVARACFIPNKSNRYLMASDGIRLVVNEKEFSKKFIHDYINSIYFRKRAFEISTGSTRLRIGLPELKTLLVIKPPKSEQSAIATILSDTDALIEHLEKLIAKKIAIKQGAMQQLLTGKKRLPGFEIKKGYKQTELGVIPEDWEVKSISEVGEVKRGASSQQIKYLNNGGVRLIRINDFFENNPVFVLPTDDIMRYKINKMDILFAGTGNSAGASCMAPLQWEGLPHSYNAPRIRINKNSNREYIFYCLQSNYIAKQQKEKFVGAAQPFLDTTAISNFKIIYPSRPNEQSAIATILSDMDAEIENLEQNLDKYTMLKQGMMQQLLTGRIRIHGTN